MSNKNEKVSTEIGIIQRTKCEFQRWKTEYKKIFKNANWIH